MTKQVCKLQIVDTFGYGELKEILDAIEKLGYSIEFADNGNILVAVKDDLNNTQSKKSQAGAFDKSEKLKGLARQWNKLQARATNENDRKMQEQADELKKRICKEFDLKVVDLVELAKIGGADGEV